MSGNKVAAIPVVVPAETLVKFLAVKEEPLAVAVGGDRAAPRSRAKGFRAEPQILRCFKCGEPRIAVRDGDGDQFLLDTLINEPLDLGPEQVE